MKRFFLYLLLANAFAFLVLVGYFIWNFGVMGPRLLEPVGIVSFVSVKGPDGDIQAYSELSAKSGDKMVWGTIISHVPVCVPKTDDILEMPTGVLPYRLKSAARWNVRTRMKDGTLLAEVPPQVIEFGYKLALNVDRQGNVVGDFPWYDVVTRRRVEQLPWGAGPRKLFKVVGLKEMQTKQFEIFLADIFKREDGSEYEGKIQISACDLGASRPQNLLTIVADGHDTLNLFGLSIKMISITSQEVRYMVVEPEQRPRS